MTNQFETDLCDLPKKDAVKREVKGVVENTNKPIGIKEQPINSVVSDAKLDNISTLDKIKIIFSRENINKMIVIGIIYIILTSETYKTNISDYMPFINVSENKFNTNGILFTAILFGVLIIILQTFSIS